MGLQIASTELSARVSKTVKTISTEDSHKAQITFFKPERRNVEQTTVYGLQEKTLAKKAFENLLLKF